MRTLLICLSLAMALLCCTAKESWAQPWNDEEVGGGGGENLAAVAISGVHAVAVGKNGAIWHSATSGAAVWNDEEVGGGGGEDLAAVAISGVHAVAVGDVGAIWHSATSGAAPWNDEEVGGGGGEDLKAVAISGANIVTVGDVGAIWHYVILSITTSIPIPFQSKWLLVLVLVGYSLWAINKFKSGSGP